jgi:hypothetical protein
MGDQRVKTAAIVVMFAAASAGCLAGCASSGGGLVGSGGLEVSGDENGGKIPKAVSPDTTKSAMQLVTAHCAKYGKKAFITRMDSPDQGGLMAFQCLAQGAKPAG